LYGEDGDDTIASGIGNDTIYGGIGSDTITIGFTDDADDANDVFDGDNTIDGYQLSGGSIQSDTVDDKILLIIVLL